MPFLDINKHGVPYGIRAKEFLQNQPTPIICEFHFISPFNKEKWLEFKLFSHIGLSWFIPEFNFLSTQKINIVSLLVDRIKDTLDREKFQNY
jgi:hypothetical protein